MMIDGKRSGQNRSNIMASPVRVRTLVRPAKEDCLSSITVIA
jgi:hypothetical protein